MIISIIIINAIESEKHVSSNHEQNSGRCHYLDNYFIFHVSMNWVKQLFNLIQEIICQMINNTTINMSVVMIIIFMIIIISIVLFIQMIILVWKINK